jgi:hypothetical protein
MNEDNSGSTSIPPCIVPAGYQAAKNANTNECPTLHVFLVELTTIVFEKLGDPHTATAVFTALLFVATFFLWIATRSLVRGADKTAERQLRAYVFIEDCIFNEHPAGGWHIHLMVKNSGQTPAYDVVIKAEREIGPAKPDDVLLPLSGQIETQSKVSVAPGKIATSMYPCNWDHCDLPPGIESWNLARQNRKRAYLWGRIDYVTFGVPRFTTFQMVNHFGQVASFSICQNGNDAS